MIARVLPYPLLSGTLALVWMVLNQSVAPATILMGVVLGIVLGSAYGLLQPPKVRVRRPGAVVRLFARVMLDIARSNLAVARLILGGRREVNSGFVAIPLALADRHGLAVLACIITSTPGTVWVSYDARASVLLVHVLDLVNEDTWIETIQCRYETLLMEIFE